MAIVLFAAHYSLWFAALTSIYGYVSTYTKIYANATATDYGVLYAILPFVTIGSKLLFCSLADRHRAWRTYFVIFLSSALLSLVAYAVLPFIVEVRGSPGAGLNVGAFVTVCLISSVFTISTSVISCLSDAFAIDSAKKNATNYGLIRLWGTIAWGLSAILLTFINDTSRLPALVPGLIVSVALVALDIGIVVRWPDADDFNLSKSASDVGVRDIEAVLGSGARPGPPGGTPSCSTATLGTGITTTTTTTRTKTKTTTTTTTTKRDNDEGAAVAVAAPEELGSADSVHSYGAASASLPAASTTEGGAGTRGEPQDRTEVATDEARPPPPAGAQLERQPMFRPELAVDITSVRMQWILFKQVASRRKSIFRFMSLFTISGVLISLQWSYFFLYLEKIYPIDFIYISSLSMVGQSFLGELPFFLFSQNVIQKLGRSHTLSISIASIGIRYLLYRYLLPNVSMYFVLMSEMFQGPNFGLFYVVMTEVGLDYSDCEAAIVHVIGEGIVANDPLQIEKLRQALRATMQSLMSACYEGLGAGLGAIIGGLIIDNLGYEALWSYAAAAALLLGLVNFSIDMLGLRALDDRRHEPPSPSAR